MMNPTKRYGHNQLNNANARTTKLTRTAAPTLNPTAIATKNPAAAIAKISKPVKPILNISPNTAAITENTSSAKNKTAIIPTTIHNQFRFVFMTFTPNKNNVRSLRLLLLGLCKSHADYLPIDLSMFFIKKALSRLFAIGLLIILSSIWPAVYLKRIG